MIFIAVFFAFVAGIITMYQIGDYVSSNYKEENQKLADLNAGMLIENQTLRNQLRGNSSKTNYSSVPQFTMDDLKLLRNLAHPDKHKNSVNAEKMFIKINSLIK